MSFKECHRACNLVSMALAETNATLEILCVGLRFAIPKFLPRDLNKNKHLHMYDMGTTEELLSHTSNWIFEEIISSVSRMWNTTVTSIRYLVSSWKCKSHWGRAMGTWEANGNNRKWWWRWDYGWPTPRTSKYCLTFSMLSSENLFYLITPNKLKMR